MVKNTIFKDKSDAKIFMIGCGAVAQCTLPILVKKLGIRPNQITVMDFVDNRSRIADLIKDGVSYVIDRVNPNNYKELLSKYLSPGDIFIDLGWNIDTVEILNWCHENNIRYVNSSVELWDPYAVKKAPCDLTLYVRQMAIKKMAEKWNHKGASAIVDHGANPGLVSHFTKHAIVQIAEKIIKEKPADNRVSELQNALSKNDFAKLAQLIGLKTIHISERDSQISNNPKRVNEFVNTWSVEGLYEEGVAPAEMGWGSHERLIPEGAIFHKDGPKNQICLTSKGINTLVRSWVPSGEIIGMVIRHGEAFGISDRLTVWDGNNSIYRPTVHYAYCVSDATLASIYELKMRDLVMQPEQRIMNNDIIDGKDELGCLLMGHDFKAWWVGSILDIHQARELVPNQNATTVQVAISVVAAVNYMFNHPEDGVLLPDDIDYKEILDFAKPFLGEFVSKEVNWSPLDRSEVYRELDYSNKKINQEDEWQFVTFLVSQSW